MKNSNTIRLLILGLICVGATVGWSQVTTFDYTGGEQTYIVPPGVSSIQIETWGAEGGTGTYAGVTPIPGKGGYAIGSVAVTPGEELHVYVGGEGASAGPGGYNGGGQAGTNYGASGGGASDVRAAPYGLDDRIIVAGGGGGAAFGSSPSNGGHGGGLNGINGQDMDEFDGGGGGSQIAGGAAGCCYGAAEAGFYGEGGGPGDYHNAGGGGGWYGGGSGAGQAAAGGGSSYIEDLVDASTTAGLREGHGQVIITVLCIGLEFVEVETDICFGDDITLDASSETGGIVFWDEGIENGEPFVPGGVGTYTYTATSTSGTDCNLVVEVVVHALPTIVANADPEIVCYGQELTLSGSGGAFYEWGPGDIVNGVGFIPDLGVMTYTVEGEDWYGCFNTAEIEVTVIESPDVSATVSDDKVCFGESITLTGSGAISYEWDLGVEDGVSFVPEAPGVYVYTVEGSMDDGGCTGEASIEVTVYDVPTIESAVVIEEVMGGDGSIDITVTGGVPAYDFDWDNDGVGEFGDDEDLTGIAGGTYTVVVMDANGCEATETFGVDSQVGINQNAIQDLIVYPNPSNDFVTISLQGSFTYSISAITGEILYSGVGFNTEKIDLSSFASGLYLVDLNSNGNMQTIKLMKN